MRCGCRRLWFTPALGADPLLTDIVLERVRESRATGDR
jgi:sirohydrochlorin ferrochelatase